MDRVDQTTSALAEALGGVAISPGRLGFSELREANTRRAFEWNPTGKDLGGPFAACELAGEVGEAIEAMSAALGLAMATGAICNATKKAERARAGIAGGVSDRVDLGHELADVVICADLVAMRLGVDLGAAVVEKFNLTSRERGFGTRLDGFGTPREEAYRASAVIYREQRDALLAVLRCNDALAEIVAAKGGSLLGLTETSAFKEAEAVEVRCRSLGIDTDRWCMRDDKPAQPAAAESAKSDIVRGGED